ncbi:MAG: CDP-diacylglycerol--glycerol-3-phosphate 3-phosphatidyltransferase [Chthoniobacterales bacterium]
MNLPNKLTVLRLFITAAFVFCLTVPFPFAHTVALLLFITASITDYLDGSIARRHNLITDFGKLMDPVADKILTAAAFICLIPFGLIPAWVVIVIIAREFLITGLRLLASNKGTVLPAEKLGKHKTAWQITTIIFFLLKLTVDEWSGGSTLFLNPLWQIGGPILIAVTTVLTIYSGVGYLVKNRHLLTAK